MKYQLILIALLLAASASARPSYPWHNGAAGQSIAQRFEPPLGFERVVVEAGSFADWLRNLPLKAEGAAIHAYNGAELENQTIHAAVIDLDVGSEDLQQCADAVIRLRAEYLFVVGHDDSIVFHFTSGDAARWTDWKAGRRPQVSGNKVRWKKSAEADSSYAAFRSYLNTVFRYAGTLSLSRELRRVDDPDSVEIGDVFIQGGSPGHAVIVVDLVENRKGEKRFLLAQSYMPAQEVHILRTPTFPHWPWYPARPSGHLSTPSWTFRYEDLRRFP